MTRPKKNTVDYFPHTCTHGETLFIIEERYGNDGYAAWFKILERLGATENHFIDMNNPATAEYLRSKIRISRDKLDEILDLLALLGAIDAELWSTSKLIWSQKFVDGISDVYTRFRHLKPPLRPHNYAVKPRDIGITTQENPQSKVKESKGKESKKPLSPEAVECARYFLDQILSWKPDFKKPLIDKWAETIDLMIRIDNRNQEQINAVVDYVTSDVRNGDGFPGWRTVVLGPKKLREKWDQITARMPLPIKPSQEAPQTPKKFTTQLDLSKYNGVEPKITKSTY